MLDGLLAKSGGVIVIAGGINGRATRSAEYGEPDEVREKFEFE